MFQLSGFYYKSSKMTASAVNICESVTETSHRARPMYFWFHSAISLPETVPGGTEMATGPGLPLAQVEAQTEKQEPCCMLGRGCNISYPKRSASGLCMSLKNSD